MIFLRVANCTVPAGNQVTGTIKTLFTDVWNYPQNFDNGNNQGRVFKFKAFGYITSTAAGTLAINIELGGVILGTATATLPSGITNGGFEFNGVAIVCTSGVSGLMSCQGFLKIDNPGTTGINAGMVNTGLTTTGQKSINTQTTGSLGLSALHSVTGNTVTLSCLIIEEEA